MMIQASPIAKSPVRAGRKAAIAADIELAFDSTDKSFPDLLGFYTSSPKAKDAFCQVADYRRRAFEKRVLGINAVPETADQARKWAYTAMQAGLIAGAMDGVIAFAASSTPPPITVGSPRSNRAPGALQPSDTSDDIKADLKKLMDDLSRAAQEAAERLKAEGPQAMRAFSRGQKRVAAELVEKSTLIGGHPHMPVKAWQACEAAAFGVGYTVAVNDAAIFILANQQP